MSEQLDFGSVVSILRRRRRVIVAAGLLGAVVGVLFVLARPPLYSSTATVLLPPITTSSGDARDMVTETQIATSDVILDKARTLVKPTLSRDRIGQLVSANSPSQDLLNLVAQGS